MRKLCCSGPAFLMLAISATSCSLTGPEGDPNARLVVAGEVHDGAEAPLAGITVFAAYYRTEACGVGSRYGFTTAETDDSGQFALTMNALATAFTGCVELTTDTLAPPPWARARGVRFREGDAVDTLRVSLVHR